MYTTLLWGLSHLRAFIRFAIIDLRVLFGYIVMSFSPSYAYGPSVHRSFALFFLALLVTSFLHLSPPLSRPPSLHVSSRDVSSVTSSVTDRVTNVPRLSPSHLWRCLHLPSSVTAGPSSNTPGQRAVAVCSSLLTRAGNWHWPQISGKEDTACGFSLRYTYQAKYSGGQNVVRNSRSHGNGEIEAVEIGWKGSYRWHPWQLILLLLKFCIYCKTFATQKS